MCVFGGGRNAQVKEWSIFLSVLFSLLCRRSMNVSCNFWRFSIRCMLLDYVFCIASLVFSLSVCLSVCVFVWLSLYAFFYMHGGLFPWLFLSVYLCISVRLLYWCCLCICLYNFVSVSFPLSHVVTYLLICLFVSAYLSVCLSRLLVCLPTSVFVFLLFL